MFKKSLATVLVAVGIILSVTGCNNDSDNNDRNIDTTAYKYNLSSIVPSEYNNVRGINVEKGSYISVIGKEKGTSYWNEVERGARQAAEDLNKVLGYSGEDKIKVTYNAPSSAEKTGEQVNILDEELSRYPDVVVISTIDNNACLVQFDLAKENGIPILAMDSYNKHPGIKSMISTNNVEAGNTVSDKMIAEIGRSGEILIVSNSSESGASLERSEGIRNRINETEGVDIASVINFDKVDDIKEAIEEQLPADSDISVDDMTKEELISYIIDNNENIKGCIGTNYDATQAILSAVPLCERAEEISVMGFDAGQEQLTALEQGSLKGIVVQNPFGMGYASVVTAAKQISGQDIDKSIDTGYIWVTTENMESDTIKPMLYK